jgi:glycosyltransferase involved in cell wall biosynthesis
MKIAPVEFSVVLPCYNEAESIPVMLAEYEKIWPQLSAELVLVNNGSTDHTSDVMKRELANPRFAFARSVTVPVNRGYGYGVMAGLRAARGTVLSVSHADLQCPPADLFRAYSLLAQTGSRTTVIKGKRSGRSFGLALIVTNLMAVIATTVLGMWLTDINAQPKVFHRSLLELMDSPPDGFELDLYILYTAKRSGWNVETFPVIFGERAHGESKWAFSLRSRWKHIVSALRYIFSLGFGTNSSHQRVADAKQR